MGHDEAERAIESVYRTHAHRFVRVARAITRDPARAEDAVQEAFVNALRKRRQYRGDGSLESWIWRMVVNAALRASRERTLERLTDDVLDVPAAETDSCDLSTALRALPPRQRLILFLRYYADLDYAAIAEIVGVEIGTVSATLHSAHRNVRRLLGEEILVD